MADYTIELRRYVESFTLNSSLPRKEKIEEGRLQLFNFDYPFFDETYRKEFETHFIRHFYFREIGFETIGLFKMRLEDWLTLNMPYYNLLFQSERLAFDPLLNSKLAVSTERKLDKDTASMMTGESIGNDNTTASGIKKTNAATSEDNFRRDLDSDNPDSRLAITSNNGQGVIEYAKNIAEANEVNRSDSYNNTTNSTNAHTTTGTDTSVETTGKQADTETTVTTREGKVGSQSYSKLLMEYRKSLLRIEKQCFDEMNELFMLVY